MAKYVQGGSAKTVFVYDAAGQLAAEYSTTATTSPCATCYLTSDHLGTTRLITDAGGNVISRHDYLPFDEEVAASMFGRDSHWGPTNDSVNQKFTGKERDQESGLDYFGARYYGSALGRFTSDPGDPQSWNGYAYVTNNPLASIDPDGLAGQKSCNPPNCWSTTVSAVADTIAVETFSLLYRSVAPTMHFEQKAFDWASQPRNGNCLAASTATGASLGAGYGLFGLAGGPATAW